MSRQEKESSRDAGIEPFTLKEVLRRETAFLLKAVNKRAIAEKAWDRANTDVERTQAWAASHEADIQIRMVGEYKQLAIHLERFSGPQRIGEPFIPFWVRQFSYGITVTEPDANSSCLLLQADGSIRPIHFLSEEGRRGNRVVELGEALTGVEYIREANYVTRDIDRLNQAAQK